MKEFWAESVSSFTREISQFERRHVAQWFYRGHGDSSHRLIPSLFRLECVKDEGFSSWDDLESYILRAFQREAVQYLTEIPQTEIEWIILAQHHRLPTRLLDWTFNPLISLYFAVANRQCTDADVWCIGFPSTNNCLPQGTIFSQRKTLLDSEIILFPRHINERIINQSGCFTIHENAVPMDEDLKFSEIFVMNRVRIRSEHKRTIKSELYDMGIHESFIFPGMDSLAKRINYELTEMIFRHTNEPE